jgi:hypothetical protein
MLIKCPECQRDVSDIAAACPGCGHPLAPAATPPLSSEKILENSAPRTPTMAESFMLGALGKVLRLGGFVSLLLSLIGFIFNGPSAPSFLILGIGLIIGGAYAKYVSQNSVRITK